MDRSTLPSHCQLASRIGQNEISRLMTPLLGVFTGEWQLLASGGTCDAHTHMHEMVLSASFLE